MPQLASMARILVRANLLLAVAAPFADAAEPAPADGDIAGLRERLRAEVASGSPHAQAELDRIAASYGDVTIVMTGMYSLVPDVAPVGEAARALEFAQAALQRDLVFTGLLPAGNYTLGATRIAVQGGSVISVSLVDPPDIQIAPTCGPCCHGSSQCWENLGPPPELNAPIPDPAPKKKKKEKRASK